MSYSNSRKSRLQAKQLRFPGTMSSRRNSVVEVLGVAVGRGSEGDGSLVVVITSFTVGCLPGVGEDVVGWDVAWVVASCLVGVVAGRGMV